MQSVSRGKPRPSQLVLAAVRPPLGPRLRVGRVAFIFNPGSGGLAAGILIQPASGVQANVTIERTRIENNFFGIIADGTGGGSIRGVVRWAPGNALAVRVVVCSGRVYVGDVGAAQRFNFTIIGNAVNETFRLEKLSDYGVPLVISGLTVELINASPSNNGLQMAG